MENSLVHERMQSVFRIVFNEPALELSDELTASEVPGWDSLHHTVLMMEIERVSGASLSPRATAGLKNIGELFAAITAKLESK